MTRLGTASRSSLVWRFAAASLLVFVATGIGVSLAMAREFREHAEQDASHDAKFVTDALVRPALEPTDLSGPVTGPRYQELSGFIEDRILSQGLGLRVKLWAPDGTILFSDVEALVGTRFPPTEELREALQGDVAVEVATPDEPENVPERGLHDKVFETYVPIRLAPGDPVAAVFEIYRDYSPIQAEIDGLFRFLGVVFVAGLLVLYAALLPIALRAARDLRRQNARLGEAESRYRTLVERIPAIVYFAEFGTPAPWIYISPRVDSILGFPPEEWIEDPALWMRRVHPDDLPRVMEEEDRSRDSREAFVSEYRMLARDGRVVWVRDEAEVVEDESGNPSHLRGVMLDITERKRAEEERREAEERFQRMAASANDAIIEIDDGACITFWNDAAERLFGYSQSEAAGRPLHSLIAPQEHLEAFTKGFDGFGRTGQGPVVGTVTEIEALRRDGTRFPVEVSVSALRRDHTWGAVGIVRDVSERKRAEEELRESLELLRRTDLERRRLLERVVSAQEEERRSLASDIYDGPLEKMTALGLHLGVLRRRCSEPAQLDTIAQLEETMEQAVGGLRHLIFELRPAALEHEGLAAALHAYLEETAAEAGFDYQVENRLVAEPPSETRTILYRIAQETLNNVRKHADANRVDVLLEPGEGGFFVRVADDGVGFAPEEAEASLTGAVGLAAMRERAEMAGGWCRVESAPGRGTTVEFWLPARSQQQTPPSGDPSAVRVSRSGGAGRRSA